MEPSSRTPVQSTLTDFFPNSYSRSAPRMAKSSGGVGTPSSQKRKMTATKTVTTPEKRPLTNSLEPELPLPSKLNQLLKVFSNIDFIVFQAKETVTFEKLKAKVELATQRTFDLPMLAKVLTVLDENKRKWFNLRSEFFRGRSQLIISAVYEETDKLSSTACLNSYQRLLLRKTAYSKMLLEITKRAHLQFLASVGLTLSPEKTMFKWHPLFKLDEVNIEADMSLLPAEKKAVTNNANTILKYFVPVSKMAEAAAAETAKEKEAKAAALEKDGRVKSGKLKGISLELLAKVREKEAARKARLMFRSPETDRELLMLGRTEPAVRIIASYFTSTGARSFTREQVVKKLADSMKMTCAKAEELLAYLLSLDLRADPTDLDKRWLRALTLSDAISYIVLQAPPRLSFLKEQIAKRTTELNTN